MTLSTLRPDPVADDCNGAPESAFGNNSRDISTRRPDWLFRVLVTALFAVAGWLLAMPFVPGIAHCTMRRFHLQTNSFATWALQQPIPPMYSFANTTEVRDRPPEVATPSLLESPVLDSQVGEENSRQFSGKHSSAGRIAGRMINHFPTREFTFANARVRYLNGDRTSKWYVLKSTYLGQSVQSVYRLDPFEDGGWTVKLIEHESSK
jgi:hypothetical protein